MLVSKGARCRGCRTLMPLRNQHDLTRQFRRSDRGNRKPSAWNVSFLLGLMQQAFREAFALTGEEATNQETRCRIR
jgi:hypothetical protein